ncbi:PAS domain S-box protein [Sphingobium sp. C100]|uniref:PAS domain S-box protein n=1 Tax=Sphingobium sp. C100 TaxID=1207055 RepID=UPI000404D43A|nr:PAS domain S-box protein [Sphingobium sp. C100]
MLELSAAEYFERTSDCVFVIDPDWTVSFCNERARRELHRPKLVGSNFWNAFPAARGSVFEERYRLAINSQLSQTFEAFYPELEGWYDVHAVPVGRDLAVFFRNVTERRAALERAEARRKALDALFDQVFLGIMQLNSDDQPIMANEHLCEMLGRSASALRDLGFADWVHPEDLELLLERLHDRPVSAASPEFEIRLVHASGETRWCSVRLSFVCEARVHRYSILVFKDVTEQRAEQNKAAETAALLHTIVESAEDLIFVKDLDGRFVLTNRRLDLACPSLLGRTVEDAYPPDLAAGCAAADRWVIQEGKATVTEELLPVKGEQRTFHTITVPWRVGAELRGVIGISRDITERREAEVRVREREERYRLAARATNDAIWDWDLGSGEVTWTQAIEQLHGGAPASGIDWWIEHIHPDEREDVAADIHHFIRVGGEHWQGEYRFARADGSYAHILDRGFLVRNAQGKAVRMIGAMADMSQRVAAQQRLNRLQADLIHVSRVSAMGTMASALAHELNQPLTGIANYVSGARRLLEARGATAIDQVLPALALAAKEVAGVGEMIRGLRRMVAHGRIEVQPLTLQPLVDDVLSMVIPNPALTGIEIVTDLSRSAVKADPVQIQQVLVNLIRNAIEAMEGAPVRTLRIASADGLRTQRISVSDTGSGLSDDVADGLFSAFRSTKRDGLGVGLTICRTIIEAHNGMIGVEATGSSGTTMVFELPLSNGCH